MRNGSRHVKHHQLLFKMENIKCRLVHKHIGCYIGKTYNNEKCEHLQWNRNGTVLSTTRNEYCKNWVLDFALDCDEAYVYSDLAHDRDWSYYNCSIEYKEQPKECLKIRFFLQHRNIGGQWRRLI